MAGGRRDKIAVYEEEVSFENGVHFHNGVQALQATPDEKYARQPPYPPQDRLGAGLPFLVGDLFVLHPVFSVR